MALAVATFLIVLALIASERVHRTKVALLGAAIVVLFVGQYNEELAIESVEFATLGLLAGMMILVYLTQQSGVYDYIAVKAGQLSRGRPFLLVVMLVTTVAVMSGFLDNLTTILLIVPITFLLADTLDINPMPLILIEVMAANIGGAATLIGDPPNIMIGNSANLSFNDFLINNMPGVVVILATVTVGLYFAYRSQLQVAEENRKYVQELDAAASIRDHDELRRTLPVLIGTIILFFLHQYIHVEPATIALTGAAVGLMVTKTPIEEALEKIEWTTLFFFIGLFVMVGALEVTGAIEKLAEGITSVTNGNRDAELVGIIWTSSLVGGIVDNIPLTAAMIPVVEDIKAGSTDHAYWWALSLGACFGGNLTLISAACNVAASGMAEKAGRPIGFWTFLKVGFPVTVASTVMATAYVLLRF
ncbi:MAG TPA: ArsB/NhaD family transporter [Solirubrobacterales bacterium]|nr:ArsB/NhaD family transporter [Solirubrobacterales bacterium]HMY25472.1 ArsB/NhaD family transporter [Solirubrobacterales bacterium]HNA43422.1 ArsB/NhaD family transporter [Solirubrobacterales bacterium]HNC04684.1 ArsB/NhaD family transporter [Solirubrobacterales bacterium]HNC91919.1 ArsB/NhaD family transporter [Solirubrobacterales bacterium]